MGDKTFYTDNGWTLNEAGIHLGNQLQEQIKELIRPHIAAGYPLHEVESVVYAGMGWAITWFALGLDDPEEQKVENAPTNLHGKFCTACHVAVEFESHYYACNCTRVRPNIPVKDIPYFWVDEP